MDFYAAQAASRRRTRWLLLAYALAVAAVVAALTSVVMVLLVAFGDERPLLAPAGAFWRGNLDVAAAIALLLLAVIGLAALYRTLQLRGGGGAVALALGGTKLTRETQDPRRRRLLNVVEEMAIASGVPVPAVYVLEQESGINAFAAGYQPADAAIAVTRGALEQLNRAELQGVIGHEFSHVLNGDMRLNTRLAGPLFGLLVIAIAARSLLRELRDARAGRKAGVVVLAACAVMAFGYLGVWLGRLLQAAICRQREFLADASSVQFTRDSTGLRDALLRIARGSRGSRLVTAAGEDLAHLFVAQAYQRAFATHPPLAARVRALDPRYPLAELSKFLPDGPDALDEAGLRAGDPPGAQALAADARLAVDPATVAGSVGNPGLDAVRYAQALRAELPPEIAAALLRGATATCLWLAAGLAADAATRAVQLEAIRARLGASVAAATARLAQPLAGLPLAQRLPMLQRTLPALAALPRERRLALVEVQRVLASADGRIDVLEYLLGALAARYLTEQVRPQVRPPRTLGLADAAAELGVLFATFAHHGHAAALDARRAYERGLAAVLPRDRPTYAPPPPERWAAPLDAALATLDRLAPHGKEAVVEGLVRTIEHDGAITVREAELLRATCALLHCPLPPLLAALHARVEQRPS